MTCHTKEVRLGKDQWVHAMRDRERESTPDEVEKEVSLSESHRSMVNQNHFDLISGGQKVTITG